jgi:hypothetical protein
MPTIVKNLKGEDIKLPVGEYRRRRAQAYKAGTMSQHGQPQPIYFEFSFEVEEWRRGKQADLRLRAEIADGLR